MHQLRVYLDVHLAIQHVLTSRGSGAAQRRSHLCAAGWRVCLAQLAVRPELIAGTSKQPCGVLSVESVTNMWCRLQLPACRGKLFDIVLANRHLIGGCGAFTSRRLVGGRGKSCCQHQRATEAGRPGHHRARGAQPVRSVAAPGQVRRSASIIGPVVLPSGAVLVPLARLAMTSLPPLRLTDQRHASLLCLPLRFVA